MNYSSLIRNLIGGAGWMGFLTFSVPFLLVECQIESDIDQYLLEVKQAVVDTDELFSGLSATWKTTEPSGQSAFIRFDQLSRNVWRSTASFIDETAVEFEKVAIRDDWISFVATGNKESGFVFDRLGMDELDHADVRKADQFPFRHAVYHANGVSLARLLTFSEEFNVKNVLPTEIHKGFNVVGIEFSAQMTGKVLYGSISWLPEQKNMLRSCSVVARFVDDSNTPKGKEIFLCDVTVDYEFYDDRLLPWRIISKSPERQASLIPRNMIMELIEVGPANPDRSYYTAEALGLETPKPPRPKWIKWALISVTLLAGVLFFWFRRK